MRSTIHPGARGGFVHGLRRWYFPVAGLLLLALAIIGFSDNLFTDIGQASNADPKFIVHGLFCLAWMIVFAVQANLIRAGNVRLHRRLGTIAMVVAAGVTFSTLYVFIAVLKDWAAMPIYAKANRLLLPAYALFVVLGFLNRRRPDRHKRYLYIGTLFMMEPVLSRAMDPFIPYLGFSSETQIDRVWWRFFIVTWNGFFLSLLGYDWVTDRRLHPVSIAGYLLLIGIWIFVAIF